MVSASDLLLTPVVQILGRILLHFVWQGLLVALVLWVLFFVFKTAQVRYILACTALVVMTLFPIFSGIRIASEQSRIKGNAYVLETLAQSTAPAMVNKPTLEEGVKVVSQPQAQNTTPANAATQPTDATSRSTDATSSYLQITVNIDRYLPWIVVIWFLGVVALSVRFLGGLLFTQRLRNKLTKAVPKEIEERLEALASKLNLKGVQILESLSVQVPMVIGWLKPVVLLPTSSLSGLSVKQLEMILAHELAHIRRNDYLINVLQTVIETLFFYHPAVWWVSQKVREEREHCCDDLAVALCGGSKLHYAQALASLDSLRPESALVMAASGGSLVNRIERLAGRTPQTGGVMNWLVSLMLVFIPWLVLSTSYAQAQLPVEIEQNIDAFVNGRLESWKVPGIQVAVIQDGEVTFNKAYGLANVEQNVPMRVDTPIPLGSGSWIVNALAAMILVDQGKLDLYKTIADYLPWVKFDKGQESKFTVRQLVANDANIPDAFRIAGAQRAFSNLPDNLPVVVDSKETFIQALMPDKLYSSDGLLGYDYSYVTNDVLLSLILEQVPGMLLEQLVQDTLFEPLQIKASYNIQLAQHPNVATTYHLAEGEAITFNEEAKQMAVNEFNPPAFLDSIVGLSMSSRDMVKILLAVVNQDSRVLSPQAWNTFLSLEQNVWGAGGWWANEINGVHKIASVGGTGGTEIFMELFRDTSVAYVVMSNYLLEADTNPVYQVLGSISMGLMMFDENTPFKSIPFKAEHLNDPSESNIERIAGNTYASAIGDIEFYKDGNQLKSNILNHEVLFKQNQGLGGFVTQSDYAPLDGLVLEIHRTGIDMWFRQFAYKTN